MNFEEYKKRMIEIRHMVNSMIDDMGGTYCNAPEMLEKVLNIAMNGDFGSVKGGKVKTDRIISVSDFRNYNATSVYM